ncbi:hypothetical protein BDV18DRAFT_27557 [Aspergillus unguis]
MASRADPAASTRPRSRRSIAHVSRSRLTAGGEKENATADVSAARTLADRQSLAKRDKKLRSKSLGPGGLDALQASNGNRRKSAAVVPLKSILKPTAPVSPVRNIPTFEETRRRTPARGEKEQENANSSAQEGLLIEFDTPARKPAAQQDDQTNPFDTFNASTIRDEMAAAREQEEKERRERERKAAQEHREARRKSMANRRVSFAPEATLHTWNVVEIPDDSTSSSASNSTRRASSLANAQNQQPAQTPKQSDPSSSPEIDAESDIAFSPVQYPDLERLRNQPPSNGYNGAGSSQEILSSPFSGSEHSEDTGLHTHDDDDDDDSSSDSGFDGESTAMSMDDMSVHSGVTAQTDGSESTTGTNRLNESLRQAARQAGTRSVDDEDEEVSMEIADQEITGAFQPWIKKGQRQSFDWEDISARHDQENVDPSKSATSGLSEGGSDNDEDMSMEVTNAIGQILPNSRRSIGHRKSTATSYEEQTMELTDVVGGIAQPVSPAKSVGANSEMDNDEEMTMEFTSVVGGVLNRATVPQNIDANVGIRSPDRIGPEGDNAEDDMDDGADMEITGAVGGILPDIQEQAESADEDQTAGMDFTAAMGKILTPERPSAEKANSQAGSSPFRETIGASPGKPPAESPANPPAAYHITAVASENGSPSLASVRSRRTRQSLSRTTPTTPTSMTPQQSPTKASGALPAPLVQTDRPSTPEHSPPSRSEPLRSASPKKPFQPELQVSDSQRKSPGRRSLFGNNAAGESAPLFVLRPPGARRSSGLGIDKEGLGSPKVAAMLDKRRSIGEEAGGFVPQPQDKRPQDVRFEDPIKLQEEVDREREEEESREDGHIQPPNSLDPTASLRDMISSLTPKKDKIRGRKSLHVGAARGILGKRPAELDIDDEDEAENTPKRLRRPEDMSPVKNIRLPPPPTKEETISRGAQSPARKVFGVSPSKASTTPIQTPRASVHSQTQSEHPASSPAVEVAAGDADENSEPEFEPIQLQDFLNMTNIHFMELTTTKRRHTTAPDSISKRAARLSLEGDGKSSAANFDECVAAGFCTVPMLELYQHSCRELKSYISEGRQIIRSIETETYADNPPLFREYMTAAPDIRLLMDNQFRNVKTHTRLLSKATWYEWRMKLLEGLKEGLDRHMEEMKGDDNILSKHETLLQDAVPALAKKHATLEQEATNLQQLADELENCDQDELWEARGKLADMEEEIASKKKQLEELQSEVQDKTSTIETGAELKMEFTAQIREAERVKEECRGWSAKEIRELKDSVHRIEHQTGWSIISASVSETGPVVTMSYKQQLHLQFHPGSFHMGTKDTESLSGVRVNAPIELSYRPSSISPISLLIFKAIGAQIRTVDQSKITPKQLLRFVSEAWSLASDVEEEARMLGFHGVTNLRFSEVENNLRARCTLLGTVSSSSDKKQNKSNSRIDVDFAVTTRILETDESQIGVLDVQTEVLASKVYGFGTDNGSGLSEKEMRSILSKGLRSHDKGVKFGGGIWSNAVQVLSGKVF